MLNHRLFTKFIDEKKFVEEAIQFLQKHAKIKKFFVRFLVESIHL